MQTSETISAIATALAAAQAELTDPVKDRVNPHLKSRYVNITDGLAVARPVLSKHGIAFVQATSIVDGVIVLTTRLVHKSGEWMSGDYPVCNIGGKHTDMGAALTYSRRFALFSLIGIAGADDDMDGADAAPPPTRKPAQRQAARAEAEAYVTKALAEMADIESADRLNVWWRAEAKNRQLYFEANDDPLYVRLKDHAAIRGKELAEPVDEAAQ